MQSMRVENMASTKSSFVCTSCVDFRLEEFRTLLSSDVIDMEILQIAKGLSEEDREVLLSLARRLASVS